MIEDPLFILLLKKNKTHFDINHFNVTRRWVNMAIPYTSNSVLAPLQNLNQQTNRVEREAVLKAGLKLNYQNRPLRL